MITESEIFLDTNILVHYTFTDFDAVKYAECREVIDKLRGKDIEIAISTQILRGFYAVVTASKYFETPLEPDAAKEQILYFTSTFNVADITQDAISELTSLIEKYKIKGQKIHDVTIVATMLNIGNSTLLSYNKRDFVNFNEIKTIEPIELLNTMAMEDEDQNDSS
jgi:predicted nucleic acid-binding protein